MRIALDFDETYTADTVLWDAFVQHAKERGHEVLIVSFRFDYDADDIRQVAGSLGVECVLTNARQKQHVVQADIWIDDMPEGVVAEASMRAMLRGCEVNNDLTPPEVVAMKEDGRA